MEEIKETVKNGNLDFFKFICSILVIMIHVNLFAQENQLLNFIFVQVLPRIAVPFFFMISGYFFKKGIDKRKNEQERKTYFYEKIKRLVKIYIQISVLYIPVIVIETIGKEITINTILHYISNFFIEGIYYHLWFLIALIYYTIFYFKTQKYHKLLYVVSIICYVIGIILHSYSFVFRDCAFLKWILGHPYIYDNFRRIITYGFPFYILGTQIYIWKDRINKKIINIQTIICTALFLVEIFSLYVYSQSKNYTITVFLYPMCYFVFCKLFILPNKRTSKMKWDKLATLIYFLHPLVIKIVTQLFKIIEIKISSVITYIIVVFFTLMISFMLLKFYNKRKEEKMKVTNLESRNISEESEFTMPPIGLGTYPMRGKELIKTVIHSKKEGYQLYDTSSAYGNEKWLGLALKLSLRKREDYFIITKVSNTEQREGNIKKAFERQLERLGVDYIDLYLMHWPQTDTFVETWKQMEEIYREGKVKMIGVSNFHEHHLEKLLKNATVAPAFNEIELHPLLSQEPLVKYCQSKRIRIISYSPFARMDKKLIEHPVLVEIANKYSKKVTQIILKWNVQLGYIPIPKTSNKQRLKENIDIFDFELTQDDMKKINSINENYRVRYDPDNCDFSKL